MTSVGKWGPGRRNAPALPPGCPAACTVEQRPLLSLPPPPQLTTPPSITIHPAPAHREQKLGASARRLLHNACGGPPRSPATRALRTEPAHAEHHMGDEAPKGHHLAHWRWEVTEEVWAASGCEQKRADSASAAASVEDNLRARRVGRELRALGGSAGAAGSMPWTVWMGVVAKPSPALF